MSSLRILMVAPRYKPAIGGLEKHVEKVCDHLLKAGHKLTILTSSHKPTLSAEDCIDGIYIIRIPYGIDRNPLLSYLWILKNRKKLTNFDLVHIHDPLPLLFWYLPLLALNMQVPVYATFHGFERDPVPIIFKVIRRITRKLVKRVLCIGGFIESIYGVQCDKTSIGAVYPIEQPTNTKIELVFVGRLEKDTGILEYIQALILLKANYKIALPLTICGSGGLSTTLKSIAQENNLNIHFMGLVDDPISIMSGGTIALAAGYLSILEEMSAGLPVIAIAKSPLKYEYYKQIIVKGGPLSIQTTTDGVADEIAKLKNSASLMQKISEQGRIFANKMTWSHLTDDYLKLWLNH